MTPIHLAPVPILFARIQYFLKNIRFIVSAAKIRFHSSDLNFLQLATISRAMSK